MANYLFPDADTAAEWLRQWLVGRSMESATVLHVERLPPGALGRLTGAAASFRVSVGSCQYERGYKAGAKDTNDAYLASAYLGPPLVDEDAAAVAAKSGAPQV